MEKNLAYYMCLKYYKVVIKHTNIGKCQVIYPELPGCVAWVDIYEDIEVISENVLKQWLEAALHDGYPIPEPKI